MCNFRSGICYALSYTIKNFISCAKKERKHSEGVADRKVKELSSLSCFILEVLDYSLRGAFVFFAPGLINHN